VRVIEVVDGDTVDIRFENGSTDTVRLLGIDTPETSGAVSPNEFEGVPDSADGRECLREESNEASDFTEDRLEGIEVRLQFDNQSDRRGSYDRLLAYVIVDGMNFNYQLVQDSYARVYDTRFTQSDRFFDAVNDAQDAEQGVWRCRNVTTATPTSSPTPSSTPTSGEDELVVNEIHEDAEGNDHENLNDEYVVFKNTGDAPLELSGWKVEDEADHTYHFPSDFTLDPGDTVTLYTGSGEDTDSELYWGSGSAIWNNGGDTIYVYDDDGETIIERSYD
jgi:endonuclease YncB( thermonuclease family)